ncbi:MAG: 1-acyl-sn-glycerol-3-phosphate acyltransferase [Candidatus Methylomirabilota bacterium]|nr:1-acyl-sn-glycerol-3-phosphate acyltransferase [candidate division NC10 bacterium]PWB48960.1 MAG: 1-acyl-sn-glycerol-3-phosphate acyltransferase [candidate division NC10 bacterium]
MRSVFLRDGVLKKAIGRCVVSMIRLVCLGIAKVAFRLQIEGQEHIPRTGPGIVAANHVSYIDPIIIGIAVRRPVRFMAKKELFSSPLFGWLIRQLGAFPVNRDRTNLQAFKLAASSLAAGEIVAIFPEGTRGDGVKLRPAKPGIGLIAARTGAPVIPTFHQGTGKVFPKGAWFPRPYRIAIKFGAPCQFTEEPGDHTEDRVATFSRVIMDRIAALKASLERGPWSRDDRMYAAESAIPMKETRQ